MEEAQAAFHIKQKGSAFCLKLRAVGALTLPLAACISKQPAALAAVAVIWGTECTCFTG